MPRAVKEAKLDTRTARSKLPVSSKPYYRVLDHGLHLGYRKNRNSGRWVARFYDGKGGYVTETLGTADDTSNADGLRVLDWRQAQERARQRLQERVVTASGVRQGPYTVNDALDDYIDKLTHNGKSVDDTRTRSNGLIRPELGEIECRELTSKMIRDWMGDISSRPPKRRGGKAADPDMNDPEVVRRRRSTANRTFTMLKAALNHAFREEDVASDAAWRRVQPYKETESARMRYLDASEIERLLNAAEPDFRSLVNAALFTGCRYGELCALTVADFLADVGKINVRASKVGKARHVVLTTMGQEFFAQLTRGRRQSEHLLLKDDHEPWGTAHQARPMRAANDAAGLVPSATFQTLRHTYASSLVMAGVPLLVLAKNLGHSDTRMVEKHYGHLAPSYVADTIRKLAPDLGQLETE